MRNIETDDRVEIPTEQWHNEFVQRNTSQRQFGLICMELKFVSANHIGMIIKKEPRPPRLASELDPGNLYHYFLCVIYGNEFSPLLSAGSILIFINSADIY